MSDSRGDRSPGSVPDPLEAFTEVDLEVAPEEQARLEAILEERSARAHAGEEQLIDNDVARRYLRLRPSR